MLSTKNYCAPLNVLVVNGAVSTNEHDSQIGSVTFMENAASATAKSLTNGIGAIWGITGSYYFGHADGAGSGSAGYDICSGKSLTGLGEALGICPGGSDVERLVPDGRYRLPRAHQQGPHRYHGARPRRRGSSAPPLQVDTYGVSIAGGIPRIPVKFKGETQSRVVIQPAYRLTSGTYGGGGALVDARIIRQIEEDDRSYGTRSWSAGRTARPAATTTWTSGGSSATR